MLRYRFMQPLNTALLQDVLPVLSPTDFTVTAATTTAVSSQNSSRCSVQVSTDALRLRLSAQQLHACNALAAALSTAAASVESEPNCSDNVAPRATRNQPMCSHDRSVSSDLQRSDVTVLTCCSEAAAATAGDSTDSTTVCEGKSDSDSSTTDASKWHTIEWIYAVPTRVRSVAINSYAPALTATANTVVLELGYIDVLRQDAFAVVWQRQLEFGSTTVAANSTNAAIANVSSMQRFDHHASNGAHISNSGGRNISANDGNNRWHFSDSIAAGVGAAAAAPLAAVWQLRWTLVPHNRATSSGRNREYSSSSSSSETGGLSAVLIAAWLQQWVLITSLQSPLTRYACQIVTSLEHLVWMFIVVVMHSSRL
jgi:hypothetical protein